MRTPDLIDLFNQFIKKWTGDNYPHLIDSDENDGERFREVLRQQRQHQAKLEAEVADLNRKLSNEIRRRVDIEAEASIKDMALRDLQGILCDPDGNPAFQGSQGDHDVARKAFEALSHPTPPLYSAVVEDIESLKWADSCMNALGVGSVVGIPTKDFQNYIKGRAKMTESLSTLKKLMGRE